MLGSCNDFQPKNYYGRFRELIFILFVGFQFGDFFYKQCFSHWVKQTFVPSICNYDIIHACQICRRKPTILIHFVTQSENANIIVRARRTGLLQVLTSLLNCSPFNIYSCVAHILCIVLLKKWSFTLFLCVGICPLVALTFSTKSSTFLFFFYNINLSLSKNRKENSNSYSKYAFC